MTTDTNFVATGPGNVGVEVQGNVKVGVEATGTSAGPIDTAKVRISCLHSEIY
jgi:hypothetical protein